MLSIQQKLSLKSWFLWGILAGTAFSACTLLGFAPLTTLLMAGSLGSNEISVYFGNFRSLIMTISSVTALLFTGSVSIAAFIFLGNNVAIQFDKQSKDFISNLSRFRTLNTIERNERWLLNAINKLSKQTGIKVDDIIYREILSLLQVPNKFRQNAKTSKKTDLMVKIKKFYPPSLAALRNSRFGSIIFVDSSVFDPNKKVTRKEIVAALAHEFGHLAHHDTWKGRLNSGLYWITILLGISSMSLLGLGLALTAHLVWYSIQQNRELMADAYATQFSHPDDLISCLSKIEASTKKLTQVLKPAKAYFSVWHNWCSTHPTGKIRIEMLQKIQQENAVNQIRKSTRPSIF